MDRVKKIEQAISMLRPCLNVINYGKVYKFMPWEELTFEKRCEYVKKQLEKIQEILRDI